MQQGCFAVNNHVHSCCQATHNVSNHYQNGIARNGGEMPPLAYEAPPLTNGMPPLAYEPAPRMRVPIPGIAPRLGNIMDCE
jgi:hypothetical protein